MKKYFSGAVALAALVFFVFKCSFVSAKTEELLIYKIERNGTPVACLVGSFHVVVKPATETTELTNCVKHNSVLAFESLETFDWNLVLKQYARDSHEHSFQDLNPYVRAEALSALKNMKLSHYEISNVLRSHPYMVFTALNASNLLLPDIKLEPNYDLQGLAVSKQMNLPVFELEGTKLFFSRDKNVPLKNLEHWILSLTKILNSEQRIKEHKQQAAKLFQQLSVQPNDDSALIWQLKIHSELLGLPKEYSQYMIDERNQILVGGLIKAIAIHKNVLAFVGAAHIGGENGMLAILRKQGYTVIRVQ